jgi:hypothetical protein
VGVQDALRAARRAAGVAERGGGAIVDLGVVEAAFLGGEQLLVAQDVGGERARVALADHDVALDALEGAGHGREQPDERVIENDDPVLGMVDDVGELLGE